MNDSHSKLSSIEQIKKLAGSLPTPKRFKGMDINKIINICKKEYWTEKCKRDFKNLKLKID